MDPMLGDAAGNRITIALPNEPLRPGPSGERLEVVDYDGGSRRFYEPVDLDDPALLMQEGLDPAESDPRFHQQMVYAVAIEGARELRRRARPAVPLQGRGAPAPLPARLPRRERLLRPRPLRGPVRLLPRRRGEPRPEPPGPDGLHLPLARHHRARGDARARPPPPAALPRASNRDVLAFHEGFADIVAIFQHFSFPEILTGAIQETHARPPVGRTRS